MIELARYGWQALLANEIGSAVTALGIAARGEPQRAEVWSAYGVALAKAHRHIDACHAFNRAVALAPGDVAVWGMLGELLLGLHDYKNALQAFREVIKRDPTGSHAAGVRVRGLIRKTQKQLETA